MLLLLLFIIIMLLLLLLNCQGRKKVRPELMQSHTMFIFGISVHRNMVYFNVYLMMIIKTIMCVIYFYLKLMLFSLGQCH